MTESTYYTLKKIVLYIFTSMVILLIHGSLSYKYRNNSGIFLPLTAISSLGFFKKEKIKYQEITKLIIIMTGK